MVGTNDCKNMLAPTPAAIMAINFACGQLGLPYQWAAMDQPGRQGFDCSGFTMAAYNAVGISLPRTAKTQYNTGLLGTPMAGDLIFYRTAGNIHRVDLHIDAGKMVRAPDFGQPIQVSQYRWNGDDYLAASRPVVRPRL
ncbi:C40 family peptidase [Amycolatopsis vastitatis]|uniref:C40 family peptidase n=1 Tax=Amycolatopsis vastitatis TaxID=1905142 RepID=UPI001F0B52F9|nr:C40 family peptidase [Amycolatopsis vastitatis]